MQETLPRHLSSGILEFCATISAAQPLFIQSRPAPDAGLGYCFENVKRIVASTGGSAAFGWAIWHMRGTYYEAEHHGVWRSPAGELLDVSPQMNGYSTILFLPDDASIYDPANFRPNIFAPESADPTAVAFVAAARRRNEILNSYRQPGVTEVTLNPADQIEVDQLFERMEDLLRG